MAMDSDSVAPKERVKITYKPDTGDAQEERELPLRMLVLADFSGRPDDRPVEERRAINVDKNNFEEVLANQNVSIDLQVPHELGADPGEQLSVHLEFRQLKDFGPDAVARQIPELRRLLEIREALIALKGPLSNDARFRKSLQRLLEDREQCSSVLDELLGSAGE